MSSPVHRPHVRPLLPLLASLATPAILEPDADGTLHVPLPEELRHGKVRITATVQRASEDSSRAKAGVWTGRQGFWMAPDFDDPLEDLREYMA